MQTVASSFRVEGFLLVSFVSFAFGFGFWFEFFVCLGLWAFFVVRVFLKETR